MFSSKFAKLRWEQAGKHSTILSAGSVCIAENRDLNIGWLAVYLRAPKAQEEERG